MEYKFKKIETNGSGYHYNGIHKTDNYISFSKIFLKILNCDRISVFTDKEQNAIMFKKSEDKEFTYTIKGKNVISLTLREMPNGRYYFKEEQEDGFICVLNN